MRVGSAVVVKHEGRTKFACIKLPQSLPRFIPLSNNGGGQETTFVFLEDVVCANVQALFPGTTVRGAYVFRIVSDTDMVIQEDEADDLLETIDEGCASCVTDCRRCCRSKRRMPRRVLDIRLERCRAPGLSQRHRTGDDPRS